MQACEGASYSEPLGARSGHLRELSLLWLLPGSQGKGYHCRISGVSINM